MWWFGRNGASGFSASSTAEEVTHGIDGTGLTAIVTGFSQSYPYQKEDKKESGYYLIFSFERKEKRGYHLILNFQFIIVSVVDYSVISLYNY